MTATDHANAASSKNPHDAVWPRRIPKQLTAPATSLWHNLAINALRYPDKPALVFFNRVLRYAQLMHQAERLALRLQSMGVKAGDRVVLYMQNCPQWVVAHFAILRANAVVVPVNPMNKADELTHYVVDPDAKIAIVAADLAHEMAAANTLLPQAKRLSHLITSHYHDGFDFDNCLEMPKAWVSWLGAHHVPPVMPDTVAHTWPNLLGEDGLNGRELGPYTAGPDDLAVLPYTSGTTGLPKGCMHTHGSLMHNAVSTNIWGNGNPESVVLSVVPMFHITGMVSIMHASIYGGATLVVMPRWDREYAADLIAKWKVTHWTNIPTMVIDLLGSPNFGKFDLSSLNYMGGGGAAMPQAVAQRLWDLFGLRYAEGYGLTETAAPSHSNPVEATKQQCLGIPFIGVDARIIDPLTLQELPQGEQGEIIICGPQVFKGYWKRPDATAEAFIERDGKRFFRSGDLGRIDEDGYFFMTDRLKRMINASGFKVWPAEVEALMFKHPAIQEACIISTHDAYRGETVKAVVVLKQNAPTTSEQDIIDWCKDHMAAYKYPRVVQFIDALPKSGSGKVMWRLLQEAETAKA
jgi:fatty-acyl-CoA synthase